MPIFCESLWEFMKDVYSRQREWFWAVVVFAGEVAGFTLAALLLANGSLVYDPGSLSPSNADLFRIAFWATIVPTGLIVIPVTVFLTFRVATIERQWDEKARALANEQRQKSDHARASDEAQRGVSILKELLRFELSEVDAIRPTEYRGYVPPCTYGVRDLVKAQPLTYWEKLLPSEAPLIASIRNFLSAVVAFEQSAGAFYLDSANWAMEHETEMHAQRVPPSHMALYFLGVAMHVDERKLCNALQLSQDARHLFEADRAAYIGLPGKQAVQDAFVSSSLAVLAAVKWLREVVAQEEKAADGQEAAQS